MRRPFLALLLLGTLLMPEAVNAAASLSLPMPKASPESSYGVPTKRIGNFDTAPIIFEGQHLFTVADPAEKESAGTPAIVQRVYTISANLRKIAPSAAPRKGAVSISPFDDKTFRVVIGREAGLPTLSAGDASKHQTLPILTVTEADAAFNGLSKDVLAQQWQATLQSVLSAAIQAAEPEYLKAQLRKIPFVLIGGVLLTIVLLWLRRRFQRLGARLEAAAERLDPAETSDALEAKRLRNRRSVAAAGIRLLSLAVIATWILIAVWVLRAIPDTRGLANVLSDRFLKVALLWLGVFIVDRLLSIAIVRLSNEWEEHRFMLLNADDRARIALRRPTLARAAENLKFIVLWIIGILWTVSILSLSATSVLTIGAIVAFALSFAAQNLIKDYLNGFLILAEDQYAIGDLVTIGGITGHVEDLTLRITRIRTNEGLLVTIPNSTIAAVENASRSWSRIDFRLPIAASSNVEKALAILQSVLDAIAADPAWRNAILEPPKVLGVDAVSQAGIVLRAWIKTLPSEKHAVTREINLRAEEALRSAGIQIGLPLTQAVVLPRERSSP